MTTVKAATPLMPSRYDILLVGFCTCAANVKEKMKREGVTIYKSNKYQTVKVSNRVTKWVLMYDRKN